MKKRNLQSSYNYRFQEESKRKRDYEKLKKIREAAIKPEDATEELEYMKKLLSGEDVGNFGPEEPLVIETNDFGYWMTGSPTTKAQVQAQLQAQLVQELQASRLTLSELLSIETNKQIKRI